MAGSLYSTYLDSDSDPAVLMGTVDRQRIGYHAVTLTEWTTSTVPAIAAGGKIEVGGALYVFDSEEAVVVGGVADGTVYIKVIPAGSSITAEFTATAPTWDDSKQGWYGTGGSATHRYIHYVMTKATAAYSNKAEFFGRDGRYKIEIEIGDWNMDTSQSITVAHGLGDWTKVRRLSALVRNDADTTRAELAGSSGEIELTSTNIVMERLTGGGFDGTDWNATSYNRGWITIESIL